MTMLFFSKCFFWVVVAQCSTAFKQWPWTLVFGLLLAPFFYICGLLTATKTRERENMKGLRVIIDRAKAGEDPTPPAFIFRKLEQLEREATTRVGAN